MLFRPLIAIPVLLLLAAAAHASDVMELVFQVSFKHGGQDFVLDGSTVPYLPGNACYSWYVRLDAPPASVTFDERFILPEPLADWGGVENDSGRTVHIEDGGKVAISTITLSPDDGWISNAWCVASGDPMGRHGFEISMVGASLASFSFDVVPPETYNFPIAAVTGPRDRSVNNSW